MNKRSVDILRKQLRVSWATMVPREQKILDMRFGLTDGVSHTLGEVAKVFSVTPERIRQIEAKALARSLETKKPR